MPRWLHAPLPTVLVYVLPIAAVAVYHRQQDAGRGRGDDRGRGRPSERAPPRDLRRSENRVEVTNLPPSASWQDLKDHMRSAGDVVFTEVDRNGGGIVEYGSKDEYVAPACRLAARVLLPSLR